MKTKLKRLTTSGVALILMVSMLLSTMMTAGAIEFSGITGGGGSQNNTGGDPNGRYKVAGVSNYYQHIVGYRFSVVTEEGRMKTDTTVKDVYLSQSSRGLACYSSALSTTWKRPKSAIRQDYEKKYTFMTAYDEDTSASCLDRNLGNFNLPLSPDGSAGGGTIEAWCTDDGGDRLEALLIAAGVIENESGFAILDSTDRILVEPIFELTLEHHLCALTVTEIAVYEYELSETGYNNKYGRTYTERYGKTFVTYEEGKTFESIVKMTNRIYPNLLYEDGRGVPSSDSLFWKGAPGEIQRGTSLANGLGTFDGVSIASCIDLIEYGYGVAVVWDGTAVKETRIKLIYNVNGGTQEREFFGGYSYFASTGLVSYESILHETNVPSNSSAKPTNWTDMGLKRDGYSLNSSLSWNTNPNGTGKAFNPSNSYSYDQYKTALDAQMKDGAVDRSGVDEGTLVLYAIWEKDAAESITVIYNANGGSFDGNTLYSVENEIIYVSGARLETYVSEGGSAKPKAWANWTLSRDGYTLDGDKMWKPNPDGTGTTLVAGTSYSFDEFKALDSNGDGIVVLYAQWKEEESGGTVTPPAEEQLIVKYSANGGTVGLSDVWGVGEDYIIEALEEDVITIVSEGEKTTLGDWSKWNLTRDGYTLNEDAMWKPNASGTGQTFTLNTSYSYDTLVKLDTDGDGVVILYAVWEKEGTESEEPDKIYLRYHTNGGTVSNSNLIEENGYVKQLFGSSYLFYETTVKKDGSGAPKNNYGSWGLAKEGYILNENLMWNTKKDGNLNDVLVPGTEYSYSDLVELDTDGDGVVILYAMWDKEGTEPDPEKPKPESITVVYSPNDGSVGNGYAINGGVIYKSGKRVETVFQKNGQKARLCNWNDFGLTRAGYELWTSNMWSSGGGQRFSLNISHSYDDLVKLDTDGDGVVILYALWLELESEEPEPEKEYEYFYVKIHINGGSLKKSAEHNLLPDGTIRYSGRDYVCELTIGYWQSGEWHYVGGGDSLPEAKYLNFDERRLRFIEWNTKPDGSGAIFSDGEYLPYYSLSKYDMDDGVQDNTVILYAQWFDENSITTSPSVRIKINCFIDDVPAQFPHRDSVALRVYSEDGSTLVKSVSAPTNVSSIDVNADRDFKYAIAVKAPDDESTYFPIAEASLDTLLDLNEAKGSSSWETSTSTYEYNVYFYTISYRGNRRNAKQVPNPHILIGGIEGKVSSGIPSLDGYGFISWNTKSDGTGTEYLPQDKVTISAPLVLYAQWIKSEGSMDVLIHTYMDNVAFDIYDKPSDTFHEGFGLGIEQVIEANGKEYTQVYTAFGRVDKGYYVRELPFKAPYRVFTIDEDGVKWYLTADGSYTTEVITLDAPERQSHHYIYYYTITYLPNAEGDVGNMPEKQYALKGIEENLSTLIPTREDEYEFINWNTQGDGDGTAYAQEARVTLTAPLILYAQWKRMMCELVFEAIIQGATSKQFVDDIPGAIWVETEEGNYPIGKNGTVTVTLPKGTKYRLRAIYETGGTVYPYTAKGNYEDTEFTLTKSFTHHGIYYYAINYFYGNTALETPARHYKLHGIDTLVSSDEPDYNFGTRFRFLNTWDQPDAEIKYEPGAVYNLDQKGDLYALVGMRVAYNANGGAVGEDYGLRSDGLITNNGVPVNILLTDNPPFPPIHYASSFSLSIPYYEFGGWNSEKDGTGVEYKEGSSGGPADFLKCETVDNGEYTVLYADWTPLVNTVSFEARPEEYGAVRFGSREIVAVSGVPRGSTMRIGSSLFNIVVARDCTITRHYADGTQEDVFYSAGRSVIVRPDPEDDTAEYSYSFVGWEGVIETITQDATVVALFDREGASEPTEPTPSNNTDIAIVPTKVNGDAKLGNQFSLSATVINNSDIDITPEMGIDAVVEIRRSGDTEATAVYRIENICVPKRGTNNATTGSIFLTTTGTHTQYTLFDNTNLIYTSAVIDASKRQGVYKVTWTLDFSNANGFTDSDSSNDSGYTGFRVGVVAEESNPSRPVYQTDIPSSFENKGPQEESTSNSFSWAYYEYNPSNPSKFIKREMSDKLQITLILTPENEGGLKEKEVLMAGVPDFITRAGYGFSLHRSYTGIDSGANASSVSAGRECVGTLTALMSYPEFNYSKDVGMYSKLLVSEAKPTGDSNSYFLSLPEYPDYQTNDINDKYAHYIPMWYPDGDYQPVSKFSGLWCPIGELEATVVQGEGRVVNGLTGKVDAEDSQEEMERMRMWTNKYTIQGSMYDDIYITH